MLQYLIPTTIAQWHGLLGPSAAQPNLSRIDYRNIWIGRRPWSIIMPTGRKFEEIRRQFFCSRIIDDEFTLPIGSKKYCDTATEDAGSATANGANGSTASAGATTRVGDEIKRPTDTSKCSWPVKTIAWRASFFSFFILLVDFCPYFLQKKDLGSQSP